jgi:hypothetical protein
MAIKQFGKSIEEKMSKHLYNKIKEMHKPDSEEDSQQKLINQLINEEPEFVKRLVELYNSMDVVDFPFFISRLHGIYNEKLTEWWYNS